MNAMLHGQAVRISACSKNAVFGCLASCQSVSVSEPQAETDAREGYLKAALELLDSLEWVARSRDGRFAITDKAKCHLEIPRNIDELLRFPYDDYLTASGRTLTLASWIDCANAGWGVSQPLLADLLDGVLVIPLVMALDRCGFVTGTDDPALRFPEGTPPQTRTKSADYSTVRNSRRRRPPCR